MLDMTGFELPPIPSKRYFTIGEASKLCLIKPHVLRYWEQEFPQINPMKRRGNRRYYQRHEVQLIRQIRQLLYIDGFTISGARAHLERKESESVQGISEFEKKNTRLIKQLIAELNEVRDILQ